MRAGFLMLHRPLGRLFFPYLSLHIIGIWHTADILIWHLYSLPICRKVQKKHAETAILQSPKKDLNCFGRLFSIDIRSINLLLIFFLFAPISIKYRIGKRHNSEFWVWFRKFMRMQSENLPFRYVENPRQLIALLCARKR